MKTALELLGHTAACGPNCCCRGIDDVMRLALENVARLAREEMREAAASEAASCACPFPPCEHLACSWLLSAAKRIRAIAVTTPASDPAMPPSDVIEAWAKHCRNCGVCGEKPCAACMAGGVCDAVECRCDESHASDEEEERETDLDPLGCPGCGGMCQVACR